MPLFLGGGTYYIAPRKWWQEHLPLIGGLAMAKRSSMRVSRADASHGSNCNDTCITHAHIVSSGAIAALFTKQSLAVAAASAS